MPTIPLTHWFASLLTLLRQGLAIHAAPKHGAASMTPSVFARVQRTVERLGVLLALLRAGHLPPVRVRRAMGEAAMDARTWPVMPKRPRGWLLRLTGHHGAFAAFVVEQIVEDAEMQALLAASPQAGRLLRPLWRMLRPEPMPPALCLPRRPRKPRPGRAPVPHARRRARPTDSLRGARLDARLKGVVGWASHKKE